MLNLRKIAVTGGLASGKSSVCHFFKEFGAYVVSADEIVHELLSLKTNVGQQVVKLLGPEILTDEQIDRKKISEKVFSQPDKLKALEKIIHPAVLNEIDNLYKQIKQTDKYKYFVVEIPLLYENEHQGHYDTVISVSANPTLCHTRFVQKTGHSEQEYKRRMAFQMPQEEKAAKADFTINNNGDLSQLKNQVYSILKDLDEPRR